MQWICIHKCLINICCLFKPSCIEVYISELSVDIWLKLLDTPDLKIVRYFRWITHIIKYQYQGIYGIPYHIPFNDRNFTDFFLPFRGKTYTLPLKECHKHVSGAFVVFALEECPSEFIKGLLI